MSPTLERDPSCMSRRERFLLVQDPDPQSFARYCEYLEWFRYCEPETVLAEIRAIDRLTVSPERRCELAIQGCSAACVLDWLDAARDEAARAYYLGRRYGLTQFGAPLRMRIATILFKEGQHVAAVEEAMSAAGTARASLDRFNEGRALILAGCCLLAQPKDADGVRQAIAHLKKGIDHVPESARLDLTSAHQALAAASLAKGRPDDVERHLSRALEVVDRRAVRHVITLEWTYGGHLLSQERWAEALAHLEHVASLSLANPMDRGKLAADLAQVRIRCGQAEKARDEIKEALALVDAMNGETREKRNLTARLKRLLAETRLPRPATREALIH